MKKLIRTVVVAATLVAGSAFVGAPAANAAYGDSTCDWGESCLYYNFHYLAGLADTPTAVADLRDYTFSNGQVADNKASSGFGNGRAIRYNTGGQWTGNWFILGVNQYDPVWTTNQPNANSYTYNFDNTIGSSALYIG